MSDDSFIREVEEELRSDRLTSIWDRFGSWIIGGAVAIVVAVAANTGWNWYTEGQATASGDRFREAIMAARDGNEDDAAQKLAALQADGYGQYPILARMREATLLANSDRKDEAVAAFDAIAADTAVSDILRDVARLRAAYLMVDLGSFDDVATRAEALAGDTSAMRHGAREAMGLAAYKAERFDDAKRLMEQLLSDPAVPATVAQRANVILDLIRASGRVQQG